MASIAERLKSSCTAGMAAARAVVSLQPVGAPGDKVFPPTHDKGEYAFERRRVGSEEKLAVLLDSVQSQANRLEEALLLEFRAGRLDIPVLEVKIPGYEPVTSLSAPHRIHDAIFRDSLYEGKRFRESTIGEAVGQARPWNATAMFEYCPTALIFGTWDSQSGAGAGGAKFTRALVSEIMAYDAIRGRRSSSRLDPLGIKAMPGEIVKSDDPIEYWTLKTGNEKKPKLFGKKGTPSDINHGNILPTLTDEQTGAGGVTFSEARQTVVVSFSQLRRLSFPDGGKSSTERDIAGRAVLGALALYAVLLQWREGYLLRSRCQLVPVETAKFEWIGSTAVQREYVDLDTSEVADSLEKLKEEAAEHGLKWRGGLISLQPQDKLLQLVKKSETAGEEAGEA